MKSWYIAVKNIKEVFRNLKSTAIIFVLPAAFLAIFGFAFAETSGDYNYNIAIINETSSDSSRYSAYIDSLGELRNGEGKKSFDIVEYKADRMLEVVGLVEDRSYTLLLLWSEDKVTIRGDITDKNFTLASSIIEKHTLGFFGVLTDVVYLESIIDNTESMSIFQLIAPGLIVYSIIILIPHVSTSLAENKEYDTLFRYFTSKVSAVDIVAGYAISSFILSVIQIAIAFPVAMLFGLEIGWSVVAPAVTIALVTSFFAVGVGLLIGALSNNKDTSNNIGTLANIVIGFLSGSFFSLPDIKIFGDMQLFDLVPSYHSSEAMRLILVFDKNLVDILPHLTTIFFSGIFFLIAGFVVYYYKQLQRLS